ncbi:flagellar assembly protein T N-terminal domain-containing protein [Alteromonas sp. PRIM-21]|uniref:flagellar assembly protein T N-terminal domain-containing protein n=1 Tax=Alteromonas sp. PRIM-21 TaxID=1454978 RepID=UPI0022B9459B|nr:flagellar assembly protein T N-terminal domain-containing protein [Alteromonas sp. PRIM-21]MCZ8530676.1 flagellar assembly protein T N-terminal domain-containing protein [Alteromonas sp. PRIM-21]
MYKSRLRKTLTGLVLFSSLMVIKQACAQWVQGESTVALAGAELSDIRTSAIQNAIADAAFQSGSTISAQDIMVDGLLLSSKAEIRSQGRIQRVEIISETLKDDLLTVVVNVNITPLFNCTNNGLAHRILVTEFSLTSPQQAATGMLYSFGSHVSQRFTQQLNGLYNGNSVSQIPVSLINVNTWLTSSLSDVDLTAMSTYLRNEYGQQFVVFGFVKDISLFEQVSQATSVFESDSTALRRNFTVQVYVLDTFKAKVIFNDSYHSEADWPFSQHDSVDSNNSLLWRSDFGRMVLNTIHAAITDIHGALQCETTYAQVIDISPDYIAIDLGKNSGLVAGDKFSLVKQRALPTLGLSRKSGLFSSNTLTLEVFEVADEVSLLKAEPGSDSVHVGDFVTPLTLSVKQKLSEAQP